MAGEIKAAIDRLEERKNAAGVASSGVLSDPETQFRQVMSGLDIDYAEVCELVPVISMAGLPGVMAGLPVPNIAASMYFDGLAVGLLIAEARQKQGARS